MSIPVPFYSQYECRNETLEVYASDRRGEVDYRFNNYGYRNTIDYEENATDIGVYVGSSITAGIGVDQNNSFAVVSSTNLGVKCYHFAQGCMAIDNQEILRMLQQIKQSSLQPRYYVIQFISLDRRYDTESGTTVYNQDAKANVDLFLQTFESIETLLSNDIWCFLGCDSTGAVISESIKKHSRCVAWNFPIVDLAGVGEHPGVKWHKILGMGITKKLRDQLS
jgi:hypothetical protein